MDVAEEVTVEEDAGNAASASAPLTMELSELSQAMEVDTHF